MFYILGLRLDKMWKLRHVFTARRRRFFTSGEVENCSNYCFWFVQSCKLKNFQLFNFQLAFAKNNLNN